jgi:hypothetical protein
MVRSDRSSIQSKRYSVVRLMGVTSHYDSSLTLTLPRLRLSGQETSSDSTGSRAESTGVGAMSFPQLRRVPDYLQKPRHQAPANGRNRCASESCTARARHARVPAESCSTVLVRRQPARPPTKDAMRDARFPVLSRCFRRETQACRAPSCISAGF